MTTISNTRLKSNDGLEVEFEILQQEDSSNLLKDDNCWLDYDISQLKAKIGKLDGQIDILINDADKLDNAIAVASGLLCGLIDSLFVGQFSFDEGMRITNEEMEQKIIELAKKHGWEGVKRGERKGLYPLDKAIEFLEDKFKMPSDPLEHQFGGPCQHHLRDFAHHHSPIGLFFSVLTQLTGRAYGTDTNGVFMSLKVPEEMIGSDLKRKWAIAVTDWALHLASDMHGSSSKNSVGVGAGIPGPIVSLLKAISALPIWGTKPHIPGEKATPNSLSLLVAKLYNGTLLGQRDEKGKLIPVKIDLRGEKAILQQMGKQSIPVIINDVLVRTFYFIRRLYIALKENEIHSWDDITKLNWKKIIPVYSRTLNHMMLVASGTFVAVDLGDAAIRSAIQCGGSWEKFAVGMLLRVNYPGIGRFVIALGTEGYMEFRLSKKRTERMAIMTELLQANNIVVFNTQKNMWIAAEQTEKAMAALYFKAEKSNPLIFQCLKDNDDDFRSIESYEDGIKSNNPWIINSKTIKMETYSENEQFESIDEMKQIVSSEATVQKEIENKVIDTIVALVNQANAIAAENSSMENPVMYDDVDEPTKYIGVTEEKRKEARNKYDVLKEMKTSHFWTIGRNLAKDKQTQEVLVDIIDAVDNNANATKALFNKLSKMSVFSMRLYAIGLMGIASNRIVIREIKLRLEHASKEELSELARQELETVFYELEKQQRIEKKVDDNHREIESFKQDVKEQLDASLKKIEETSSAMVAQQGQFIEQSRVLATEAIDNLKKQQKETVERLQQNQHEMHANMQAAIEGHLKRVEDISSAMTEQHEQFIKQSRTRIEQAINDIESRQKNERDTLRQEQLLFTQETNTTLKNGFDEMRNADNLFREEQQTEIYNLKRQMTYYKVVAVVSGMISIVSALYLFLS